MNPNVEAGTFGPLLRRFRRQAGLSQEELAERARMSVEGISVLERGIRRNPYRETVRLISEALDLSDAARKELETAANFARIRDATAVSAEPSTTIAPKSAGVERGREQSRRNLTRPISTFHNRLRELSDLSRLVAQHQLVSVVGAGGIGKTRLAIELALNLASNYADGVWFVDLAPLVDSSLVTRSLLSTLGLRQVDGQDDVGTLLHHLRQRNTLILIDNCEHVVDQVARLAETLVRTCDELRIVTTTREPLNVPGERVYRIPALQTPPASNPVKAFQALEFAAVTLFVDRSQSANSAFTLSDATAAPIVEICRRLDGVALAIELAASRTAVLSPTQILNQLESHFTILSGGSRTALPRQRTMNETVRWSYDRLSEPEQVAFRRSAVFVAGFSLEALRFVCSAGRLEYDAILETLTSLVNKSMIVADGDATRTRYRLLAPIRAYGLEMLDRVGERAEIQAVFARWTLAFAQTAHAQWETTSSAVWSERCEPEMDNLRAALLWAFEDRHDIRLAARIVASARRLWARLCPSEGKRWISAAQEAVSEPTADNTFAELALAEAHIRTLLEEYDPALSAARACERSIPEHDPLLLAEAREFAGFALCQLGRSAEGEQLLTNAVDVYRSFGAEQLMGHALSDLAIACAIRDDLDPARRFFREALTIFRKLENSLGIGTVAANLAEMEYFAGDVEEAVRLADEALAAFRGGRETRLCRLNMAAYLVRLQRFAEAREMARDSILRSGIARADVDVAFALQHLAAVAVFRPADSLHRLDDDLDRAARLLGFVDARLAGSKTVRQFTEQQEYDAVIVALEMKIDSERLARLYAESRFWGENEAIAEALQI